MKGHIKGSQVIISIIIAFLSLKIVFVLTLKNLMKCCIVNIEESDDIADYAAFHQILLC